LTNFVVGDKPRTLFCRGCGARLKKRTDHHYFCVTCWDKKESLSGSNCGHKALGKVRRENPKRLKSDPRRKRT